MPTYEYKCLECGKHFEMVQKMSDPHLKSCIYCGGQVHRLIGEGAGIIFKGSGFYCTDYSHKTSESSPSEKESAKPAAPAAAPAAASAPDK